MFLALVLAVVATVFPVVLGGYACDTLPRSVYAYTTLIPDFSNYIVPARYTKECLWGNFCSWEVFRSPYFVVSWLPYLFYGVVGGILPWWLLILLNQLVVFFLYFLLIWKVVEPRGLLERLVSAFLGVVFCWVYLLRFGPTQWGYLSLLLMWVGMTRWDSYKGRQMAYAGLLMAVSSYVFAGLYGVVSFVLFVALRFLFKGEGIYRGAVFAVLVAVLFILAYRIIPVMVGADVSSYYARSNIMASRLPVVSLRQVPGYALLFATGLILLVLRGRFLASVASSHFDWFWLAVALCFALCVVPLHTVVSGYSAQEWHFFYRWGWLVLGVVSFWFIFHTTNFRFRVYGWFLLLATLFLWIRMGHMLRYIRLMSGSMVRGACEVVSSVEGLSEKIRGRSVTVFAEYRSAYLLQLLTNVKPVPIAGNYNIDMPLDIVEKYSTLAFIADHPATKLVPTNRADTVLMLAPLSPYPITPLRLGYANALLSQVYLLYRLRGVELCNTVLGRWLMQDACSYTSVAEETCNYAFKSSEAFRRLWIKEASCIMKVQWDSVAAWIAEPARVFREVEGYFGGWDYVVVPVENLSFWEERVIKEWPHQKLYCDSVFCLLGRVGDSGS